MLQRPMIRITVFNGCLEHRGTNGTLNGPDLNTRAAWPYTSGAGTMIAIADVGVELAHPEFSNSVVGSPHFNFVMQITNGTPPLRTGEWAHGTECSGLMIAQPNNSIGMAGIASQAQLASWVIFDTTGNLAPDDDLMSIYTNTNRT